MSRARSVANYISNSFLTTQVDGLTTTMVGSYIDGGTKSAQFTPVVGSQYNCDFTSASWTINLGGMTTPLIGQKIKINAFGTNSPFYLGTINGGTNLTPSLQAGGELLYSSASWGWNLNVG